MNNSPDNDDSDSPLSKLRRSLGETSSQIDTLEAQIAKVLKGQEGAQELLDSADEVLLLLEGDDICYDFYDGVGGLGKVPEDSELTADLRKILDDIETDQVVWMKKVQDAAVSRTGLEGVDFFDDLSRIMENRLAFLASAKQLVEGPLEPEPEPEPEPEGPSAPQDDADGAAASGGKDKADVKDAAPAAKDGKKKESEKEPENPEGKGHKAQGHKGKK